MAVDRIGVDEQEVKGVELSRAEKNRIKRQQRKLKKFGLKDEAPADGRYGAYCRSRRGG